MKRMVSLGIVLFWLVMISLLVRRHLPANQPPPASPPLGMLELHASDKPQESWMGIYHQHKKIGYVQRRLTPLATGARWEELSRLRLRVLDTDQTVHTEVRATLDQHYALQDFAVRFLSGDIVFRVTGAVTHSGTAHSELRGQMSSGGNTSAFAVPLHEPLYLPTVTQMALRGVTLQPGEARRYAIFNPLALQTDSLSVTALATEILALSGGSLPVTKVVVRYSNTTAYAWLDQAGQVVKEEAPLGLVLRRESQTDALGHGWEDSTPLDLVAAAAITVPQGLPDPQTLGALRLRILGVDEPILFRFPPRQQYHEGILTVTREDTTAIISYPLPHTDPGFAADLAATPFVQSAHPRLIAQARRILGSERDAVQATRLLLDWTYTTLAKEPSLGVPTALDVLEHQKGDCNEHAVLFTALARAAGLPARIAAGVVYLHGAFYYHAWSEVWLGQWVSVDPVFQQFPADVTHLKFVQGGPEEHLTLLQVIGRLGIEVMAYQ
jgi:hypothetical protein